MNDKELGEKILKFDRWHYQFDLRGHLTPVDSSKKINRHLQRKNHIFETLLDYFGGSLAGKRVLDLGCNAGFWSLLSIEHGCDFVWGIDGRQQHIDQAELVFEVNEVPQDRYTFTRGNIFDIDLLDLGTFDIVLFLGLMYHINRPVEILERINMINTDLLIIDTSLNKDNGSTLQVVKESLEDPRNAMECELVFVPSRQAVVDIAEQCGFTTEVLEPDFSDYEGAGDFLNGTRRVFFCTKPKTPTPAE